MSETDGLVGIYGAVDNAVQTDAESRAQVSRLLPLYQDPELHWYDDFEAWLKQARGEEGGKAPLFPELPDALSELGGSEPRCRMRPRRLFAIAVGTRAFPEMRDPGSELGSLAVSALSVSSLAGEAEKAHGLLALLADDGPLESVEASGTGELNPWWDQLIATALEQGLITSATGMRPRPCSGQLVDVPGVDGPVAALVTEFETDEIDFDLATKFIEPENWKTCMPNFWCVMRKLGQGIVPNTFRYQEVVSSDCPNRSTALFTAETELLFNFMWLPNSQDPEVALTNYQLSEGRPLPGDLIRVDEGTLLVSKVGQGQTPLRITTTKRIEFSYPFSSQALALMMCALGYADVVGDLLCCAAGGVEQGSEFPGVSPPRVEPVRPVDCPPRIPAPSICECEGAAGQLANDLVSTWANLVRDGAEAVERCARNDHTTRRPSARQESGS